MNEIIDGYIKDNLISSNEISRFDNMSEIVISSIFKHYYNNPRLLNDKVTKRIYFKMLCNPFLKDNAVYFSEMSKEYTDKVIKNYLNLSYNDLMLLKFFEIDEKYVMNYEEIEKTENNILSRHVEYRDYYLSEFCIDAITITEIDNCEIEMLKEVFKDYKDKGINVTRGYLLKKKISYEQQKVIIRAVCDYVSGMTDTFALSEYDTLQ